MKTWKINKWMDSDEASCCFTYPTPTTTPTPPTTLQPPPSQPPTYHCGGGTEGWTKNSSGQIFGSLMISGGIEERSKKCARAEEKNVNNLTKEQLAHFSAFTIATQFMSYAKGGGGPNPGFDRWQKIVFFKTSISKSMCKSPIVGKIKVLRTYEKFYTCQKRLNYFGKKCKNKYLYRWG